ncbi:MAG: glycine--tRNA ligase subunit beta [Synechococcaceae cyanobacterium]|nr:glycine--tRNA ligase subunit beta [Synechococcaceae cyanobacterium]
MATFLLEIGTEELPADFARQAVPQLEDRVRRDLAEARLGCADVHATSTPRRLAVSVEGLAGRQEDRTEERKGPPAAQAFRDGAPTPAALGFARRCGVPPGELEVRDTPRGAFVFAATREPGLPAQAVLPELIPAWIWSLQGRRFMRWGEGDARFSRPVRWLVALLDDDVVPVQLGDCDPPLASGRHSRGHRLRREPVAIATAEAYASTLAAMDVQVERATRARWIGERIERAAAAAGARADLPEELFEELVDLVESPQLLEGAIDERFLALPPEVIGTVLRSHQRYVPLVRGDAVPDPLALEAHATLVPRFLCVANGRAEAADTIRRGNERVLRARLADAEFFVRADLGVASIDRRDLLDRVTFAEGLGSLRDRTERLEWCTDVLLEHLPLRAATGEHARRAAHLCKHDLVSQMVGEFPELQGVMGGKYLLAEGEPREVALAVLEHYRPRGAGDDPPWSDAGAVVALAERLELLLSIFARGERPSGSSDPYALRRAGNGLLQILWARGWSLDLATVLGRAAGHWADLLPQESVQPAALAAELAEFLRQRIASLLEEEGLAADLVQAVAGGTVPAERLIADPADARRRADLLAELRGSGELAGVQAVVTRAARLAEKGDLPEGVLSAGKVVDPALFTSPSERAMLEVLERLEPIATGRGTERYAALARGLAAGADTLAAFFDGEHSVLVMTDDPAVRANRLNLLGVLRNQAAVLADFSRIAG